MLRFDLKYPLVVPVLMLILGIVAARIWVWPTSLGYLFLLPLPVFFWLVKIRGPSIFLGFFFIGFGNLTLQNQREQLFYLKLANARALWVQATGNPKKVEVKWVVFQPRELVRCEGVVNVNYHEQFKSKQSRVHT